MDNPDTPVKPSSEDESEQQTQEPLLAVDLVIVDVALPAMNGIDLVAALHERFPTLPCLMLSGHTELNYVRRALDVGARGYVMKGDPFALPEAVRTVLAGEIYLSEEVRQNLAK